MERAPSFIHFTGVIEQTDVRQNRSQAVVGLRQIALQGESTPQFGNRFQVLEIFRGSPQQKGPGEVSFREIRVYLKRTPTVEFSLFQPHAGWIKFEVASRTRNRKGGVAEGKSRVSSHSVS
jgi:hypothetical protein